MRLLLASAGITNASIRTALVDLLGKPIADSTALCMVIKVTDDGIAVISEGHWRRFEPAPGSKGATV